MIEVDPPFRAMICLSLATRFEEDRMRLDLPAAVERLCKALTFNGLTMNGDEQLFARVPDSSVSAVGLAEAICSRRQIEMPEASDSNHFGPEKARNIKRLVETRSCQGRVRVASAAGFLLSPHAFPPISLLRRQEHSILTVPAPSAGSRFPQTDVSALRQSSAKLSATSEPTHH